MPNISVNVMCKMKIKFINNTNILIKYGLNTFIFFLYGIDVSSASFCCNKYMNT
jgi:hypothetical protein